jgi:hypothetical protein
MMKEKIEAIDITPDDSVVPIYLVELTPEEIAERELLAQQEAERLQAQQQAEIDKQNAIETATAKLAKIGLSIEEIQAVIGIK